MVETEHKERTEQESMDEILQLFIEKATKQNEESNDQSLFYCRSCNKSLPYGQPMITVSISKEVHSDSEVNILSSDCFLYFCLDCAGDNTWDTLAVSFMNKGNMDSYEFNRQDDGYFITHVQPEASECNIKIECSICKKSIEQEEPYYCIPVHQEKIVDNEVHVLEAEVHLNFCSKCADRFDFSKIKVAHKQAELQTPINPMDYVKVVKWHWN
jgi:hypothetical protein